MPRSCSLEPASCRYQRGSLLVASNRGVGERLLYHGNLLSIRGDSYRLREKRRSGPAQTATEAARRAVAGSPS